MEGVYTNDLKIIELDAGNVLHGMKAGEPGYNGFGEAYFSAIYENAVKAWKCHNVMTLNFIVPVGAIRFAIYDERKGSETRGQYLELLLSRKMYRRLTISPGLWVGFQGVGRGENLLLNLADRAHDPGEVERVSPDHFRYEWRKS